MEYIENSITLTCSLTSRTANAFISKITPVNSSIYFITTDGRNINAKSLIGLLSAQLHCGEKINVIITGNNKNDVETDFCQLNKILSEI